MAFSGLSVLLMSFYHVVRTIYKILLRHNGKLRYVYLVGWVLIIIATFSCIAMFLNRKGIALFIFVPSLFIGGTMTSYVEKKVYKIKKQDYWFNVFRYNLAKQTYWMGILGIVVSILLIPLFLLP
jgi:uncharacterized membrane protein